MEKPTRDEVIGSTLVKLRGERSQQWLADSMRELGFEWAQATVWSIEKGKRPIRLAEAEAVAQLLECEVVDLLLLPRWYSFFDALIAVEKAEEEMLGAAARADYALGTLARAADALLDNGESRERIDAEVGVDRGFNRSPGEVLSAQFEGFRHGRAEGPYTTEYLSRADLLVPTLRLNNDEGGEDGERQAEA